MFYHLFSAADIENRDNLCAKTFYDENGNETFEKSMDITLATSNYNKEKYEDVVKKAENQQHFLNAALAMKFLSAEKEAETLYSRRPPNCPKDVNKPKIVPPKQLDTKYSSRFFINMMADQNQ